MENLSGIKKVLLLNPPGSKKYFRDYYCAKVSKARYYYHPIDLVYLSGRLSEIFDVKVLDAIAENLNPDQCFQQILNVNPQFIIFLSSAPSYNEDLKFLAELKNKLPQTILIGSGDIFRDYKARSLQENKFIDALLLDFSTPDIIDYLLKNKTIIPNIIYRKNDEIIDGKESHSSGSFDLPAPRWDLFNLKAYHFPFARQFPFASILTDFGCPFSCDFCPISSLGYKLRSIPLVIQEMELLKKLGIKELYIRDQTFGVNYNRTMSLLSEMVKAKLNFNWTCLSRTDILDLPLLILMKKAGCHTIMVGIESANEQLLKIHKKNTTTNQAYESISMIKKARIRIGGFFMIGFPYETKESINETINLACSLPIDYASFNIAVPRFGTPFRKNAIEKFDIDAHILETESSFSMPVWKNQVVSNKDLLLLKKYAVKKFYLRPGYILKRLFHIKSFTEAKNLLVEAVELFTKNK